MTAERLAFILQACIRRRRKVSLTAHHQNVARRWLRGKQPVPRQVEIILEIFYHYPAMTADSLASPRAPFGSGTSWRSGTLNATCH